MYSPGCTRVAQVADSSERRSRETSSHGLKWPVICLRRLKRSIVRNVWPSAAIAQKCGKIRDATRSRYRGIDPNLT
jgi:hypothetical protein